MSKTRPLRQPAGHGIADWLIPVLVAAREQADMMRVHVAAELRKDQATISKFETGSPRALPAEIDRYVAAYAKVTGVDDPRNFWAEAISQWQQHGSVPLLTPCEEESP